MGVPFPTTEEALLEPPSAEEVQVIARGFLSAASPDEGPTPLQLLVTTSLAKALTGHRVDPEHLEPISPEAHAEALAPSTEDFRVRSVQMMVLLELLLRPLPEDVADRVEAFADAMSVGDDCRDLVRATKHVARGALGLAASDFQRNGYETRVFEHWHDGLEHTAEEAWAAAPDDAERAARWRALEHLPDGTLGRRVWEFYRARGFCFPGEPGSAPPLLAQHDWVHVLADYGTTVESEVEVFGFIYRANDDPRAFSLLASVLGLFESGYLSSGMGLFEMDVGHISAADHDMALRLGDALRRGALSAWRRNERDGQRGGIDYLEMDWFEHAHKPLAQVRDELCLPERSEDAVAAGSVTPWQQGGISPFPWNQGKERAAAEGRPFEPYGARPAEVAP